MPRNAGQSDDDARLRFEAMFRQHYPEVNAYVRRRTTGDAGDVVGEVFLTAWRRLDRVPADALPWLLGVARKVLANARRSEHRHPTVGLSHEAGVPGFESNPAERLEVAGERHVSGVTWGDFHVVGTYDGSSFTVLDVGPPQPQPPDPADPIVIPCGEPAGGWAATDPARTSRSDLEAAGHAASAQPDSAGWWIKYLVPPATDGSFGPDDLVMNAAFTGDIERHRQELSRLWGGPLCVVRYDRTDGELRRIQTELTDHGADEFEFTLLF